jgi:hypothetical protein
MARQSSIRLSGMAVDGRFEGLVGVVVAALAFALAMALIALFAGERRSSWTAFWSPVRGSTQWQPLTADVRPRALDDDGASRANDDGYLEGLAKALDRDF